MINFAIIGAAGRSLQKIVPPLAPEFTDFPYSGIEDTLIVPDGMAYARLRLWGGAGQGGQYGGTPYGGNGGFVDVTIPVTPGDTLTVQTGQGGQWAGAGTNSPGGWPDGGSGSYGDTTGGGGGGSSRVFRNTDLVAVAGGGAGAAGYAGSGGGGGGSSSDAGTGGATGATQTAAGVSAGGGDSGTGPITYASRNTQRGGHGGPQGSSTGQDGGGGGGGYYGGAGGGGDGRAGSGGSGFVSTDFLEVHTFDTGASGSVVPPGADNAAYPGAPIARGSQAFTGIDGGDGFVQIELLPLDTPIYSEAQVAAAWGVSGIQGIYSLRLTVPEYIGPLIRGKRTSDNAVQDFYPTDGDWLDPAEVSTFAAGSDVVVDRWYNQVPNGLHATNAFGTPPHLAIAGTVPTCGGNPAVMFGGSGFTTKTRLRIPFNMWATPHTTVYGGMRTNDNAGGGATWGSILAAALTGGSTISYGLVFSTSVPSMMQNGAADSSGGTSTALNTPQIWGWRSATAFTSPFTVTPYVNKVASSDRSLSFGALGLADGFTSLGAAANGSSDHIAGNFSEFVFVPADLGTTDRQSIENIMSAALGY